MIKKSILQTPSEASRPPQIKFFIPSPFQPNEWIQSNLQANILVMHFLKKIQKTCEDIKEKCNLSEEVRKAEEYLRKKQAVFENLENLENLMMKFNQFMKKHGSSLFYPFKQEPTEDKEEEPGEAKQI